MERKVVQSKSCFPLTAISISELCSGEINPPKWTGMKQRSQLGTEPLRVPTKVGLRAHSSGIRHPGFLQETGSSDLRLRVALGADGRPSEYGSRHTCSHVCACRLLPVWIEECAHVCAHVHRCVRVDSCLWIQECCHMHERTHV